jgi:hypothetical protein
VGLIGGAAAGAYILMKLGARLTSARAAIRKEQ